MSIIITNQYLTSICELLTSLPLAGAASRARSKVLAMTTLAAQSLVESELELAREHALCDTTGTPQVDGDGHIRFDTPEQAAAFIQARGVLLAERAELSGPSYTTMARTLYEALTTLTQPFSGDKAAAYDHLCDALEAHLATIKSEQEVTGDE